MARLNFSGTVQGTSVVHDVWRTLMFAFQPFGNNHRAALIAYSVGVASAAYGDDAPGQVDVFNAISPGGNGLTARKFDDGLPEFVQTQMFFNRVVEQPPDVVFRSHTHHPQSTFRITNSRENEILLTRIGASRGMLGLRVKYQHDCDVDSVMEFEE